MGSANKVPICFAGYDASDIGRVVRFREAAKPICMADMVKGFGCRQAYESLSCRNPRATGYGYGDFEFRLMSAMA